ncbi:cysteine-rich CWC family protein [Flavitalea antarctica]
MRPFQCMPGRIAECQCSKVRLTDEERNYISQQYKDCLCRDCLEDLKINFELWNWKNS